MAISLVAAIKQYFGIGGSDLITEFKALTEQDRNDFIEMFAAIGIEVERKTA